MCLYFLVFLVAFASLVLIGQVGWVPLFLAASQGLLLLLMTCPYMLVCFFLLLHMFTVPSALCDVRGNNLGSTVGS